MKIFSHEKSVRINGGEYWWFGAVGEALAMPLTQNDEYVFDGSVNKTANVLSGVVVSSDGRYMYAGDDYTLKISGGTLTVNSNAEIAFADGLKTLKGAYEALAEKFFRKDAAKTPLIQFSVPQYSTWAEMGTDVSEEKIIEYAESIINCGMPAGVLIIDDGWMTEYGDWTFDKSKFPNPKRMIEKLKKLGFTVELWIVPYVRKTAKNFAALARDGALIKTTDGEIYFADWWQGKDAVYDMTSFAANRSLASELDKLISRYGADGFKFDGGGAGIYDSENSVFAENRTPNGQSAAYAEFALRYLNCEVRDYVGLEGSHIVTRLNDKERNFSKECGLGALIPSMICAGLAGYPYVCADMIGGGKNVDFLTGKSLAFDRDLACRSCECSALFPCMQFSYAYWRRDEITANIFRKYTKLHTELKSYTEELLSQARKNFTPLVRPLEYEYPRSGFAEITDEFMYGDKYLVAPVIEEGKTERKVVLPKGRWRCLTNGKETDGGEFIVTVFPDELPIFEKSEQERI